MEGIELSGFNGLERVETQEVQRSIDRYFGRIQKRGCSYLKVTMKKVHEQPHSEKFEIHALATAPGKKYVSEVTDRSLIGAIETALQKVLNEMS